MRIGRGICYVSENAAFEVKRGVWKQYATLELIFLSLCLLALAKAYVFMSFLSCLTGRLASWMDKKKNCVIVVSPLTLNVSIKLFLAFCCIISEFMQTLILTFFLFMIISVCQFKSIKFDS